MADGIRVLLVDDEALLRGSLRMLIDAMPDMTVVGEASNGSEAVRAVEQFDVDVILMDLRMPNSDGVEATECITRLPDSPRVLVLSTFDLDHYVYQALLAGASGFILKDTPPEQLLEAIRTIHRGDSLLAPSITRRLLSDFVRVSRRRDSGSALPLTDREREILTLITQGLSNSEIEARLYVSRSTVKTHIGRLKAKLQARDRAQLVIAGYEAGLVQ